MVGDICGLMRIHSLLENWGLINFNVDPVNKPNNPLLPKAINFKSPLIIDSSSLSLHTGNYKRYFIIYLLFLFRRKLLWI